tara:strand:+ start:312 stop:680 length:369 start_codon:yes stop_codon:yes gene_type:complete
MSQDLKEDKIAEVVLDLEELKQNPLNENMLAMFAANLKLMLQDVIGHEIYNIIPSGSRGFSKIRGKKGDIDAFAKTLGREKKYLESWKANGLNNPKTYNSKRLLDRAISGFQKKTGIKWPFS